MRPFSVVVLAAGESSRLGRPKQLVEVEGVPLICRALSAALAAEPREVILVLGAYAQEIEAAVSASAPPQPPSSGTNHPNKGGAVHIVVNEAWRQGMASSIRVGVEAVGEMSEAVVLMLCDQPHVSEDLVRALVESLSSAVPISATEFEGRAGAPCAFDRSVFPELLRLQGDKGARDLIRDPGRDIALVNFEAARIDVDTPEDLDCQPYSDSCARG